jgi:chaperonin GroES
MVRVLIFPRHNENIEKGGRRMKVQPLADRILVEVLEASEKTKGGIVLPDSAKEKPQEAKVVAVGKGKVSEGGKAVPLELKAGDKILFGKYSGTEITVDGKEYLILKEEDVLALVK